MKGKEEVINDVLHDYNSQIKTWLKTRLNGAWENGYCHGKADAFKDFVMSPMRNYDCLISKTPKELAEWIAERMDCAVCRDAFDGDCPCEINKNCGDHWLDWLLQKAE